MKESKRTTQLKLKIKQLSIVLSFFIVASTILGFLFYRSQNLYGDYKNKTDLVLQENTLTVDGLQNNIQDINNRLKDAYAELEELEKNAEENAIKIERLNAEIQALESQKNKFKSIIDRTITELTAEDLEGIESIGNYAFYGCTELISIELPDTVISIGQYAFYGCSALTNITMPNSIKTVNGHVFYGCSALTTCNLSNTLTGIGHSMFFNTALTDIELPDSVISISDNAFRNTLLTSITIPSGVNRIGFDAFNGCKNLTTMRIEAITPPSLGLATAISSATTRIEIPRGTLEAYTSAAYWSTHADKFVEVDI